jgi:hypothetical protein
MTFLFGQPVIDTKPVIKSETVIRKPLSNKEKEMLSRILGGRYNSGFLRDMQAEVAYQKFLKEENKK